MQNARSAKVRVTKDLPRTFPAAFGALEQDRADPVIYPREITKPRGVGRMVGIVCGPETDQRSTPEEEGEIREKGWFAQNTRRNRKAYLNGPLQSAR